MRIAEQFLRPVLAFFYESLSVIFRQLRQFAS